MRRAEVEIKKEPEQERRIWWVDAEEARIEDMINKKKTLESAAGRKGAERWRTHIRIFNPRG